MPTWLWARRPDVAEAIHGRNHHPQCLPGIALPSGLGATPDLAHAVHGAQLVILAVPSAATREIARQAAPLITPGTLVLTASKGIEQGSGALMTQVLDEELGRAMLTGSIGGPSFADEVACGKSTLLTLALLALERFHPQYKDARRLADSLMQQLARAGVTLELTRDAVGAQVGGALKNMIAIACGMSTAQGWAKKRAPASSPAVSKTCDASPRPWAGASKPCWAAAAWAICSSPRRPSIRATPGWECGSGDRAPRPRSWSASTGYA